MSPLLRAQALCNLHSNVCKFIAKGAVTLGVRREPAAGGDALVFAVTDTDIGLTEDQM